MIITVDAIPTIVVVLCGGQAITELHLGVGIPIKVAKGSITIFGFSDNTNENESMRKALSKDQSTGALATRKTGQTKPVATNLDLSKNDTPKTSPPVIVPRPVVPSRMSQSAQTIEADDNETIEEGPYAWPEDRAYVAVNGMTHARDHECVCMIENESQTLALCFTRFCLSRQILTRSLRRRNGSVPPARFTILRAASAYA